MSKTVDESGIIVEIGVNQIKLLENALQFRKNQKAIEDQINRLSGVVNKKYLRTFNNVNQYHHWLQIQKDFQEICKFYGKKDFTVSEINILIKKSKNDSK